MSSFAFIPCAVQVPLCGHCLSPALTLVLQALAQLLPVYEDSNDSSAQQGKDTGGHLPSPWIHWSTCHCCVGWSWGFAAAHVIRSMGIASAAGLCPQVQRKNTERLCQYLNGPPCRKKKIRTCPNDDQFCWSPNETFIHVVGVPNDSLDWCQVLSRCLSVFFESYVTLVTKREGFSM